MRGDRGVAGKGRVVGIPKFCSWSKCTMPLTNINSDWMSNASSGLCIILCYIILYWVILYIYAGPLSCILGCNILGYIILYYIILGYIIYAGPLSCILGCNVYKLIMSNIH